jgi:protocatechuate 3,4-dioxygenase, beta subunit
VRVEAAMQTSGWVMWIMAALAYGPAAGASEPVIGPCDGCEWVFRELPSQLDSHGRIAPAQEPGEPLTLSGTVFDTDGTPATGIVVYGYQTDAGGLYPRGSTRHGRLRGWVRTGVDGGYRFDTIRPGAYPDGREPEHIHLHVIEPGRGTYYIDDVVFEGDPRLSTRHRRDPSSARGGSGLTRPQRDADGVWQVRRDIFLGRNIPGR